ncbi:hypothetical protein ACHAW5_004276 [Stephanodiscus triporus]|uniref:Uncharacterized protein n=1 Tax=Stephanodiscus triporus TaxID=2934178 RepID=A0ABD3NSU1_9STRA
MIIFAFGRASCQRTIVIQGGWKMMMPFPITLSRFVFFAFLTSHGCVFGYDEVGENHRAVHESIRGTNAAMAKPSMITKLVKVGGNELVPIQSIISSGESDNDMNDGIHDRRLEVWKEQGFDIENDASKQEGWKVLFIYSGSTSNGRTLRGTASVSQ